MRRMRYHGAFLDQAIELYKARFSRTGYFTYRRKSWDAHHREYSVVEVYHYQDIMADSFGQIDLYGREDGQVTTLRFPVEQCEPVEVEEAERLINLIRKHKK